MPRTIDGECAGGDATASYSVTDAEGAPVSHPTASLWQQHPSPYASYRSSTVLPSHSDVVIIGTGLSGISTAHHLLSLHPRIRITLLEARTVCSAASGRNGGHLTCDLFGFAPALLDAGFSRDQVLRHAAFEVDTFHAMTALIRDTPIACEYTRKPHLDVCATPQELQYVEYALSCMDTASWDVTIHRNPEASMLAGTPCFAVVQHPYSASLNPYLLVTGMLARLMDAHGTRIKLYTRTRVRSAITDNVVHTTRGTMTCNHVVYATNGYTASLLPSMTDVIVPVRGQIISQQAAHIAIPNSTYNTGGEYVSQRPNGQLIVGGARRFGVRQELYNSDDSVISANVSHHLHTLADTLTHSDNAARGEWEWTGIMGFTKLGIPLVTELPREEALDSCRKYVIAGFSGHGMPRIYLAALHIAHLILGSPEGTSKVPPGFDVMNTMTRADLSDR